MWIPLNETKFGIVVYSFDGTQLKHGLSLTIGDAVQIFEECHGWYRGCLTHKKAIKGIFPNSYVHLKECTSDVQGPQATVTPLEDSVAREVAYILREWAVLWKKLYLEGHREMFDTFYDVMRDLAELRKELLTHTLTHDQVEDIKSSIVSKIDWGNKRLSLDLVPRIRHEPVDPESISPVQLYRIHEESLKSYTGATSRGSFVRPKSNHFPGMKWKSSNHHLMLNLKNFGCNVGEDTEVQFRLYDAKENKFFSEKFLTRMTKNGLPVDVERINNNIALFTDLGGSDLLRDAYLVVHVYKIATLRDSESSKKHKNAAVYKRPFGVAAAAINSILMASTDFESELTLKVCQVSSESEFHQLHENIIRKQNTKFTLPTNTVQTGIAVGLRMLHGDLESVRKEDPVLFKHAAVTRKIGFADIIMPGDVRNDLYLTLNHGQFERGSKTAGKNVEAKICVYDAQGQPLWNCISPGSGEAMQSYYNSVIFYHNNHPHWNDTIKLDIPIEFYLKQGSHIRFEFRHCSTKDKNEKQKLFGFCFLPLVADDGTTLRDGVHELFLYKVDDAKKLSDPLKYLGLPNRSSQINPEIGNTQGNTFFKRSEKENVEVRTLLCSTKLTQNVDLLAVLRWRDHQGNLEGILQKLMHLEGQEIIKYLQDILDALFSMFDANSGKRLRESNILFKALCHIFILVNDNRFEHFKPVIDTYIKNHFSAVLACRDLLICLTEVLNYAAGEDIQEYNEECLQVVEYIVKFIVQGRKLFVRATVCNPTESVFQEFEDKSADLFDAMRHLLSIPFDEIVQSQVKLLQHLPKVFTCYLDVMPGPYLCERYIEIISNIPQEMGEKIHHRKLKCLRETVNSLLFDDQENKNRLVPLFSRELQCYINQHREMKQCAELLGDVIIRLHDDYVKTKNADVQNTLCLLNELLEPIVNRLLEEESNVTILWISREQSDKFRSLSHLVASVVGLLRLLETDDSLYKAFLTNYRDRTNRRNFLVQMLKLFERMVYDAVYPCDWTVMRHSQNQVILSTLQFISQTMLEDYSTSSIDFEFEMWERYFKLAVMFLIQSSLQLEKFSEAKRQKMKEKYGDMRVRMGYEILAMWESLGVHKLHFVPALVGPFLEVTLVPETELRKATLPIFFDMMECEYKVYRNFKQVEAELIDKLDLLINDHNGDEEYKELFNAILLEKVQSEPGWGEIGLSFVQSVTRLLENLLDYRNVLEGEENRDKRMTCTVNLLHFYKDEIKRQEMYIRYIHKLTELHLESNNYTEAAFTLQLHAQLLDWTERECEETKDFQSQREWERKEQLYLRIIAYFDTGKTWEYGIPLCEELAQFYKTKIMYKKLSNIRQFEATCYDKILNEMRPEAEYFRVGFYGQGFPLFLRNKEFIYRGNEFEKLGPFTQRIMSEHSDASMLNCNTALTESLHIEDYKYIQISPVKPVPEVDPVFLQETVPQSVQNFYQVNEIDTFQLDRPFHKGEKDDTNEFKTLCIERTTMKTTSKLPGILRWFEVVSKSTVILSPIEVAIDAVVKKNEQLRSLTSELVSSEVREVKQLTMLLNGTIDAAVQGGIKKYEEAFFSEEFLESNPYHQPHVSQLKAVFVDQIHILDQALKLHGQFMTQDVKPLHDRLTELFGRMKKGIKESGSPSMARLISVTENLSQMSPRLSTDSSKSSFSSKSTPTDSNRSSGIYTGDSNVHSSENINHPQDNMGRREPMITPRPPGESSILSPQQSVKHAPSSTSLDSALSGRNGSSVKKSFLKWVSIHRRHRYSDGDLSKDKTLKAPEVVPRKFAGKDIKIPSMSLEDVTGDSSTLKNNAFNQKVPSPKLCNAPFSPPLPPKPLSDRGSVFSQSSKGSQESLSAPDPPPKQSSLSNLPASTSGTLGRNSPHNLKTSVSESTISTPQKPLHKTLSFTPNKNPPPLPAKQRTQSETTAPVLDDTPRASVTFQEPFGSQNPRSSNPPPLPSRDNRPAFSPTSRKPRT